MAVKNPYLEQFKGLGLHRDCGNGSGSYYNNFSHVEKSYKYRSQMVHEYSWSIPDQDALDIIAIHVKNTPGIIEIGSGTGYWAYLLRQMNVPIIASDIEPPYLGRNAWRHSKTWTDVIQGTTKLAEKHAKRTLMMSWPPYDNDMSAEALTFYLKAGGKQLIYIGESWGGCTATNEFFDILGEKMTRIVDHDLYQWEGMRDYLSIYKTN